MVMRFTHLHTHSHYSLLDGLAKIDDLVNRCKELGMDSIALTDHGNLYGAVEFYKKAKKAGVKPILGIETYVAPFGRFNKRPKIDDRRFHLILLAKNQTGWKNLIQLATKSHLEGFYYKPRVDKELLKQHSEGLIALSACLSGETAKLILENKIAEAEKSAIEYREIFGNGNFYLEIGSHIKIPGVEKVRKEIIALSKKTGIPLVATQDIHYIKKEDAPYHDILLAVQTGNKLNDEDRLTLKEDDFSMRSPEEMAELFKDEPEAVANAAKIAAECNVEIELGKIHLPNFETPEGETADSYLKKLCLEKLPHRFKEANEIVKNRLDYELAMITKTGFADYFLIVQDFINWAKNQGIVVGPGRGSSAGSLVSYILNITDIDPIKYGLIFERFLNPDRIQMPDIDVDFADTRRDEVVAYVREKYGNDRVAQIITFGTMAARAAVRDAGRALGLSYGFCDEIAKMIPFHPSTDKSVAFLPKDIEMITELKERYQKNADAKKLLDAAMKLEGVARHASVHACGIVISKEPLTEYLPLQYAPQNDNIIITQFEMHSVEDLGLLKMDFLGLANLTTIEETIKLVAQIKDEKIEIARIPLDDAATFKILQSGETTGVFQLESSGMRHYLKELKPTEIEDIIAMISLYRPGPMELIPQYIRRKFGKEKITYLHPLLEPILKNTYGVGVYQEQMMRIARDLAGFTLAEADTLRKAIGKKIKALLDQQKEKLINGMVKNNIPLKTANEIWNLFPPFARYGFNRSHGACYAMIGYQTAYLKAHYPIEFMASLLNAGAGDTDRTALLVADARRGGIEILPPDINRSSTSFMPEDDKIRFGLLAVKNIGSNIVATIIEERSRGGPFQDLKDFLNRVKHRDLNKKSLESLIKCGALDSLGGERRAGLENIDELLKFKSTTQKNIDDFQHNLFGSSFSQNNLKLKATTAATTKEKLVWEKELLGLYISAHPLKEYIEKIENSKVTPIKNLLAVSVSGGEQSKIPARANIAGLISKIKKTVTKLGQPMIFAQVEDLNDKMEIIVFNDTLSANPSAWQENNVLIMSGRLSLRNNEPKLICDKAVEL